MLAFALGGGLIDRSRDVLNVFGMCLSIELGGVYRELVSENKPGSAARTPTVDEVLDDLILILGQNKLLCCHDDLSEAIDELLTLFAELLSLEGSSVDEGV